VRRAALLVLVLALAPAHATADDAADAARKQKLEAAKKAFETDKKAFEDRVNAAIDRGVAWLRTQQKGNGLFPAFGDHLPANQYNQMDWGLDALVLLTFAKSGIAPEDKAIDKLRVSTTAEYARMKGLKHVAVYPAATMLLALEALYHPAAKEDVDVRRDRYGSSVSRKKTPCQFPPNVRPLVDELGRFLVAAQAKNGGWRYPGPEKSIPGEADLSNTQYALFGLNVVARCGGTVPLETWQRALEYLLKTQEKDGFDSELFIQNAEWEPGADGVPQFLSAGKRKARGWTYVPGAPVNADNTGATTGAMTCAGLAGLAICKERLADLGKLPNELSRRIDVGLLDGMAWLSDVFTVTDNPVVPAAPAMWHYYYLYGLERVGSLTGVRYHAKQDWYRVGSEHLLANQEKNGNWREVMIEGKRSEDESAITQTCFALLFLRRATSPPLVPVTPPVLTGRPEDAPSDNRGK